MECLRRLSTLVFLLLFGNLVFSQNTMSIPNISGNANDTITVSLHIDNIDDFVAFQTDIQLPTQVTYVSNSAALTARANGHSLSASLLTGNTLRVIAYSLSQNTFNGNSGSVLDFDIILSAIPGGFSLVLDNPVISDSSSQNILTGSTNGVVTIYTPDISLSAVSLDFGDTPLLSHTDHSVTITNLGNVDLNIDSIYTDNFYFEVLGSTSYTIPASGNQAITVRFNSVVKGTYAANLYILSNDPDEAQSQVSLNAVAFAVNELHLQNASGRSGYPIDIKLSINNMEPFVGFQFDMVLPSVLTFMTDSVKLTDRKSDHVVSANMISDDQLRVVAYSPTNQSFQGSDGDVVILGFMLEGNGGNYNVNLDSVIISDSTGSNIVSAFYSGTINIKSPDISAIQNIDFGEISVLDTSEINYQIGNAGNDTLVIQSFLPGYSYFWNETPLPQFIPQGSSQGFLLKFHNALKGNYTDQFTIRSNDPDEDPFYLDVSASAFAPNYIIVRDTTTVEGDTVTLNLDVDNYEEFVAFQVDLEVPDSLSYIPNSARLTSRKQDHTISAGLLSDNIVRIFSFSMNQMPFLGNSGTVAKLDYEVGDTVGIFSLSLSNGILSDSNSTNILRNVINGQLQIDTSSILTFQKSVIEGWNLLGLPLEINENYYLDIFPGAITGTLFSWNGSYNLEDSLALGQGYWLRFPDQNVISIYGIPVDSLSLNLTQGWNMISGVSCDLPLTAISDPESIVVPGTLFGFDGAYFNSDSILQGNGYWLRTNTAGQISFNCQMDGSPYLVKRRNNYLNLDRFPSLKVNDESGASQTLHFNVKLDNPKIKVSYSMPPLPPPGAFDARFEDDYRISENSDAIINIQSSHYPITISASNMQVEEHFQYVLREVLPNANRKSYIIKEGGNIQIANPAVKTLKLTKEKNIPKKFAVFQNYPNPFNPKTTIEYVITTYEKVEITIYNSLGQKVRTLVSRQQEAGYYNISWDGRNDLRKQVASGIYILTIKAGNHKAVKKMILIK